MTEALIIKIAVALLQAFPAIATTVLGMLRPDVAQSIREQLAGARATMAAAPSPTPRVLAMVEEEKARVIAAKHPRISAHHADVLARLARPASAALLTREERDAISDAVPVLREIAAMADTDLPPVLAAPAGAWTEPHEGD